MKNKGIAHFLPITENVGKELIARENVPKDKITVIHPGIPLFELARSSRAQLRAQLGCEESDVAIIGVGRLEVEKNFSCLVEAIAKIGNDKGIKVWIVGDGAQKASLDRLINQQGLESRVQLLGYRSDIIDLLGAADIFVLPSKKEPFGMSAVEAMISALPVVATRGPGLGAIVDDQVTGILVPPDDSEALAGALVKLIDDTDLRERYGAAGRKRATELFTSDGMAKQIINVYNKVLS